MGDYVAVYGLLPNAPAAEIVNQDRDDVTVVRASTTPLALNTANCTAVDGNSMDCTDALAQAAGAPGFHRVLVAANANLAACALLRVTTASKNAALANTTGIGFWSASIAGGNITAEDSGRFVAKAKLKAVGTATLRGGAAATLHEFAGVVNCNTGAGQQPPGRLFKPYMQFDAPADAKIFRNWDLATNYLISSTVTQFDRSADVLQ